MRNSCTIMMILIAATFAYPQTQGTVVAIGGNQAGYVGGMIGTCQCSAIEGAPFTADIVTETDRTLADGNRIHQERHSKNMRDSQGRTRDEIVLDAGNNGGTRKISILDPFQVTIYDPVQKVLIRLDPNNKIASVRHLQNTRNVPPVQRPPAAAQQQASIDSGRDINAEQLGTKDIEGFTVRGSRTTITIAAETIGNERPLVSTSEFWFSQELKIPLLMINTDPQYGTVTRRYKNIQRVEPDPTLFQVPPDYTVKDEQ